MTEIMFTLVWSICTDGYRWLEAQPIREGQEGEAMERVLVPQSVEYREYEPLLDVMDLFRTFAGISFPGEMWAWGESAWEDRIRHFADRYGVLGVGSLMRLPDGQLTRGESLTVWYQESYRMRRALEVWDALRVEDTEVLQRWFNSTTTKLYSSGTFSPEDPWPSAVAYEPVLMLSDEVSDRFWWNRETSHHTDPTDRWPDWPSGPVQWAVIHLRQWVNQQLVLYAPSQLQHVLSAPDRKPLSLAIIPKNLLGGIWLEFARVIDGELRYDRCAECGTWFRVKPKGNRPNTRFCKDYCRVKANRREKRVRKAAAS